MHPAVTAASICWNATDFQVPSVIRPLDLIVQAPAAALPAGEATIGSRAKLEEEYSDLYAREVEEAFEGELTRIETSDKSLTPFERDCLFTALMAILSQSYSLAMAAILACNGRGLELPIMPKASENVTLAGLRQAFAEIPILRALPVHSPQLSAGAARDSA